MDAPLNPGDQLWIKKGNDGTETSVLLSELLDELPIRKVYINEEPYEIPSALFINELPANGKEEVQDGDCIRFKMPDTVQDVLQYAGLKSILEELLPFNLFINGKQERFPTFSGAIYTNGKSTHFNHRMAEGDRLTLLRRKPVTVNEMIAVLNSDQKDHIKVTFNGEPLTLNNITCTVYRGETPLRGTDFLLNGEQIHIKYEKVSSFIFQDLFRYIEIEFPQDNPSGFHLMRNKQEVTFYDEIYDGDQLEIIWFQTNRKHSSISKPVRN